MTAGEGPWFLSGKYRMERVIGRGGMGTVWLARHLELGVDVAVKLMSPRLVADSTARARFRREARAAARLKSAHVVAVHDFGQDGETPYLVMELLEGETVASLLERRRRLSLEETANIVRQACAALSLAHDAGIVHRDIKPSNLFLARVEGKTVLKVLDFGIARSGGEFDTSEATQTDQIVGTPAFMSPEQLEGRAPGIATDLWSLAAVAYTLLTGVDPFRGAIATETIARIRDGVFTKPSERVAGLPPAVDDFFHAAFRVVPARRFGSARELSTEFESAAQSSSRPARTAPPVPRDETTQDLAPAPRRWDVRAIVLGVLASSALLLGAAYAVKQRSVSAAPVGSPVKASPDPESSSKESPLGSDQPALLPLPGDALGALAPLPSAAPPERSPKTRPPRLGAAPVTRVRSPSSVPTAPPAEEVTTDPLFGLPIKVSRDDPASKIHGQSSAPALNFLESSKERRRDALGLSSVE